MAYDKKTFLKNVVIICDTREQKNEHIKKQFNDMNIKHEQSALTLGDYAFKMQGIDFSLSCVVERKANVDELYGNLTQDRERIEKELIAGSSIINEFVLLVEGVHDVEELKSYEVPEWQIKKFNRKVKNIGEYCYSTIQSWQTGNRYRFRTVCVKDNTDTAVKILESFYWYWRNFKKLTASRRNREQGVIDDVS